MYMPQIENNASFFKFLYILDVQINSMPLHFAPYNSVSEVNT